MLKPIDLFTSSQGLDDTDTMLLPFAPVKGDVEMFSQWMGKNISNEVKKPTVVRTQLASALIKQFTVFETSGSFNFTVYFPGGSKASVSVNNQAHKLTVSVATRSRSLARKFKRSKKNTEEELSLHLKKSVTVNIIDNG